MASIAYALLTHALDPRSKASDRKNFRNSCTLETCPLSLSYWGYIPSLPANALFLALFALSTVLFIGQGVLSRRFVGFTIAMVCGCALEVIGYVGRIGSHKNPFAENPFLIQIVCLTIAPAFLAAGIYLCLSRIVLTFGPQNSRIKPMSYPRIFIPCDLASLMLQAAGGGIASAASHSDRDPTTGNNIMIAGLSIQVGTLAIFIALALDFSIRTTRRTRGLGAENALDPTHARLRQSWAFKGFLIALSFATLCIFTRSVYRVAELSEGWNGHLIKTQKYFIGLEGAIVGAAVLALNAFHPGLCFREGYQRGGGCCGCCGGRKAETRGESPPVSAVELNEREK
ncbi:putative RTA1 domain protein [Lindgomyces ingoldianus]|uniref:RTA1 domain protein n=1 Tax=Lindgomyces ingoldianus TaxID=673940 RepID=A0ACB6QT43_9PLEO|nr:putative RTA1 domain protein [Lindgomyces ingoldianus]KAF2469265.1 putative RTA1 domain protein [Lindgomyces ingoldianus]